MSDSARSPIIRVALPVPLRRGFDYLAPAGYVGDLESGVRILVPFGKSRRRVGIMLGKTPQPEISRERLKQASAVIDDEPLFPDQHMKLLRWASDYYQHPIGEVLFGAVPGALRLGRPARQKLDHVWRLTAAGAEQHRGAARLGSRQQALLLLLQRFTEGIAERELSARHAIGRGTLKSLQLRGWVEPVSGPPPGATKLAHGEKIRMNPEQAGAAECIAAGLGHYQPFLLNGVTGSGKTEVYLSLINRVVHAGRQALILVPEIGLTPQLVDRIRGKIEAKVVVLHSSLSESEKLESWLQARDGQAGVLLGTRSAIWTPLKKPGIFIIDEEHDPSYKQQEGFRYSARDVAIVRARDAGVPVVLGSATPSIESLYNVRSGKYTELRLPQRAGNAAAPQIRIVDLRRQKLIGAVSEVLLEAIERQLTERRQVLLFLNRRGYAPVIMCHACGWTATCRRCNVPLTLHKHGNLLLCHHCALRSAPRQRCPECGEAELLEIGHGTERLAETLAEHFPAARILRIDRDSTRRRGAMSKMVESIQTGDADILIGTQMLAKGHDFPHLTLVGIVDADRGLFSADFRAGERMAQLIVQVSGRAGRARHPGIVMIQTHHPEHSILQSLITQGYDGFAEATLKERRETQLPPFSYLALLRAEHFRPEAPRRFLEAARALLERDLKSLQLFGPVPAPMERRAGRFRYQLLVQSSGRAELNSQLQPWVREVETMPGARKVRWSLDVDPLDLM